ncbi:UNVERIFIED_CONTAM: hypothetical protein RKD43_005393 [Streptomyces graminofaciens]
MNTRLPLPFRLPFRLVAVTVMTVLALVGCTGSGGPAGASEPPSSPTATSSPPQSAPDPSATTAPGTPSATASSPASSSPLPGFSDLQPLWPFTTLTQAREWERAFRSGGHQPWHLDPEQTALSFTRHYLGFEAVDRVTSRAVEGREARIGVGLSGAESTGTAAVIHLARFGTGPDAPWEVVGTDDTTFSLTTPAYGSVARSPMTVGGRITGVDESVRVDVRQPSSRDLLGTSCCMSAGGNSQPWRSTVSFTGAADPVLTVVASTGGHIAEVERFTVTAVRTR